MATCLRSHSCLLTHSFNIHGKDWKWLALTSGPGPTDYPCAHGVNILVGERQMDKQEMSVSQRFCEAD